MLKAAVVVVGSVTIDRIIENGKASERLGGVVTYGGLTFQRLGVQTAIVTSIAEPHRGLLDVLAAEGVAVHAGRSNLTTHFVNRAEGDRREQLMPEAADPVTAGQLKPLLPDVRHFHAGPLHPGDIAPEALALMAGSGRLVSLDVQGYLRRAEDGRIVPAVSEGLDGALRTAHIVKTDEGELALILDHYRASLPGLLQRFRIDEAVITRGSRGASVWTRSGEGYHFGAEPVRRPVSTVGAGDVFFAAYLVGHVYRRLDIDRAATFAAGLAARQVGGRHLAPGLLDLTGVPREKNIKGKTKRGERSMKGGIKS
ncbi:MAG TPA: PfkB family carbohydrate kinase [Syntrophales bacterium]|nr:PfkB family carbohydrate kinase [Syntrophales bacterium]